MTAACAAMRREVFFEVGGFTEPLPLNFNDVDLCYKIRTAGLPDRLGGQLRAYHFESQTRDGSWSRGNATSRPSLGGPDVDLYTPSSMAPRRCSTRTG